MSKDDETPAATEAPGWSVRTYLEDGSWKEEHISDSDAPTAAAAALKKAKLRRIEIQVLEGDGPFVPQEMPKSDA